MSTSPTGARSWRRRASTTRRRRRWSTAVDATVKSDGWKKVLADKNWIDLYLSGDEFAKYLADENARVTAILKSIGLVRRPSGDEAAAPAPTIALGLGLAALGA